MRQKSFICMALLTGTLAACGSSEPAPQAAVAEAQTLTAAAPAAPLPMNAEPVDVCAFLPQAEAEKVLGKLSAPPQPGTPQGSLLGECLYSGKPGTLLMVTAHPADEYAGTIAYATKKGPNTPVPNLGADARITRGGLLFQPAGKRFFLALNGGGYSEELIIAAARAMQP